MKDNRNEMIPAQFVDWTWDLTGYVAKYRSIMPMI